MLHAPSFSLDLAQAFGVEAFGPAISNLTNLNHPEVLSELTRRLSDHGIRVLLFALQAESDVDEALSQVWRYRVDGVIAAAHLKPEVIEQLARRGVPLVLYNRSGDGAPAASVCCDSASGERMLVDRLAAAGHRRFGLITGPPDSSVGQERVSGALGRLQALGLRRLMMMTGNRLDALVCANDLMAIGAMDCARHALGLDVPRNLSIVGFDGVSPATWSSYDLTTVRQPVQRMTESAVKMLVERIEQPDLSPERRLFTGQLIEGRSARLV